MTHQHMFDIAVVGGGCIGSSILFSLKEHGYDNIALVDRGRSSTSATSQSGAMMRLFHEDPRHTMLAVKSAAHYRRLRRERIVTGSDLRSGSLYFFNRNRYPSFEASLRVMDDAGSCFEVIPPARGAKEFPQFNWEPSDLAIYESTGTHLNSLSFSNELITHSQAKLFDDEIVQNILHADGFYKIELENQVILAKQIILAGGVAMLPLLRKLGISLPLISKEIVIYRSKREDNLFHLPNYFDRETFEFGRFSDPTELVMSDLKPKRLAFFEEPKEFTKHVAADCYAPDRQGFMISPPSQPNLLVVSGWGGTALKFALEIGQMVAQRLPVRSHRREGFYELSLPTT
jgi:glycine/D-amino acid oxidase-like deaminating enzyme